MRALREAKGISLRALARQTKLQPGLISNYESGKRRPKYENACKLAAALGVTVEEIFKATAKRSA